MHSKETQMLHLAVIQVRLVVHASYAALTYQQVHHAGLSAVGHSQRSLSTELLHGLCRLDNLPHGLCTLTRQRMAFPEQDQEMWLAGHSNAICATVGHIKLQNTC